MQLRGAAVHVEFSTTIQADYEVAPPMADNTSSKLREPVHNEVRDAVHHQWYTAIPSDITDPLTDCFWAKVSLTVMVGSCSNGIR